MKRLLLLFCSAISPMFSDDDHEIASEYKLNIGQYLLPANHKIAIKNWLNPDVEDYKVMQSYLMSDRPELQYLNYPGSTWREKRIREFRLIIDGKTPQFEIVYLNNCPQNKKKCIVTYVSYNEKYIKSLNWLIHALKKIGFDGHFIFRIGGWPGTEDGSLELFDVPYAFKILALLEAKKLGYDQCLWLDSCMLPLKKIDPIFEHIERHGVYFHILPNYSNKDHIFDFATKAFGISLQEFLKFPAITATVLGLDFTSNRGVSLLNSWHELAKNHRLGFLSYIPEQAALCVLAHRLQLLPYAGNPNFYAISRASINQQSLLLWNHDVIGE